MAFNPQSTVVATGSMDTTAKLWDVQKGAEISTLSVSPQFLAIPKFSRDLGRVSNFNQSII